MMSKHLFFKAMREDLRHKLWMIALSILGNFLVLPVGWMIWRSNELARLGGIERLMQQDARNIAGFQEEIAGFLGGYLVIAGGVVAILGALIVGLFSFRYLFHKNMVDTYNSLPVKRDTLYCVNYVNGILIWFVPFLLSLLLMFFMGCSLERQAGGSAKIPGMAADTLFTVLILVVVYLLVYHVVLAAVMLSGNVLNTLVSMMTLGFGVIALYGLGIAYLSTYMNTYFSAFTHFESVLYGSPFLSAPWLLDLRVEAQSQWEVWKGLLINAGIAAALGTGAWLMYRNRASEAAEQGLWSKVTASVFRMVIGVAAGMCGWGFFLLLVSGSRIVGWGVFGAVLVSVCTFGVLDIIFQMDFKAFFSHKLQMTATVVLSLLVCLSFCQDWFGFDTRLPKKEEIAEIAICDVNLSNRYHYYGVLYEIALEGMHYQDKEILYAFLERMTEHERREGYRPGDSERVAVKVTLESGRSYYRYYWMREEDKDVVWPIVTSEEYLKCAYLIDDALLEESCDFNLYLENGKRYFAENLTPELRSIIEAYNQDILEDPDRGLLEEGKMVAKIDFRANYRGSDGTATWFDITMEVFDSMERTVEALSAIGFETPDIEALGIQAIVLNLECPKDAAPQERIALAREYYGVPAQGDEEDDQGAGIEGSGTEATGASTDAGANGSGAQADTGWESDEMTGQEVKEEVSLLEMEMVEIFDDMPVTAVAASSLQITDKEEIEELLPLLSFERYYYSNSIFREESISVSSVMKDGSVGYWSLPRGALPEKYILRFGENALFE